MKKKVNKKSKSSNKQKKLAQIQSIPLAVLNEFSKSACKITVEFNNKILFGTGFFMMIQSDEEKNISCMLTNFHIIPEKIIQYKYIIKIEIETENGEIIQPIRLENNNRFILFLQKPIDITVIEIIDSDIIKDKIKFLSCDLDCKKDIYEKYINKNI